MFKEILILIFVTLIPFFELRASIPLGVLEGSVELPFDYVLSGFGMNVFLVFLICVIVNIILGLVLYLLLDKFVHYFLRFKLFRKLFFRYVKRLQLKVEKKVDKYGVLGVGLFIGVPLPGSGVYSGALGAYFLGLDFKEFVKACIIGVLIAGVLVTLGSLGLLNIL